MSVTRYECANCGKELQEERKPCPDCGSNRRRVYVTATVEIGIGTSLKGKAKDKSGKAKRKFLSRSKLSRKGKEAREQLDIDIAGDRKFHHVEELDESGNWVVVHHEDEPLKKKNGNQN